MKCMKIQLKLILHWFMTALEMKIFINNDPLCVQLIKVKFVIYSRKSDTDQFGEIKLMMDNY